jgi:hypothetical protein
MPNSVDASGLDTPWSRTSEEANQYLFSRIDEEFAFSEGEISTLNLEHLEIDTYQDSAIVPMLNSKDEAPSHTTQKSDVSGALRRRRHPSEA